MTSATAQRTDHDLWKGRALVAKLMGRSPAARSYADLDLPQIEGRHLRAVASALGREYQYLAGGSKDTARSVLERVQTELQGRPDRCSECGEVLKITDDGQCIICRGDGL